jgi:hypothetical protein
MSSNDGNEMITLKAMKRLIGWRWAIDKIAERTA